MAILETVSKMERAAQCSNCGARLRVEMDDERQAANAVRQWIKAHECAKEGEQ